MRESQHGKFTDEVNESRERHEEKQGECAVLKEGTAAWQRVDKKCVLI